VGLLLRVLRQRRGGSRSHRPAAHQGAWDSNDPDAFTDNFAENGSLLIGDNQLNGHDEIRSYMTEAFRVGSRVRTGPRSPSRFGPSAATSRWRSPKAESSRLVPTGLRPRTRSGRPGSSLSKTGTGSSFPCRAARSRADAGLRQVQLRRYAFLVRPVVPVYWRADPSVWCSSCTNGVSSTVVASTATSRRGSGGHRQLAVVSSP